MQTLTLHNSQGIKRRVPREVHISTERVAAPKQLGVKTRTQRKKKNTIFATFFYSLSGLKKVNVSTVVYSFFCMSLATYLYMVVSIVHTTVERKAFEDLVREKTTELSYKETQYSENIGTISLNQAKELGFVDSDESVYTENNSETTFTLNR